MRTILGMTTQCANADHDHTVPDGAPMRCEHCDLPSHYDETVNDYRHDDAAASYCFLIHSSDGTACHA